MLKPRYFRAACIETNYSYNIFGEQTLFIYRLKCGKGYGYGSALFPSTAPPPLPESRSSVSECGLGGKGKRGEFSRNIKKEICKQLQFLSFYP